MSEIDYSLLNDFIVEASEHLEEMESKLLALTPGGDNESLWNDIFRPIHTIKGASQFVGLDRVSSLSHRLEDLLDLLRQGEFPATTEIIDILIEGRDRIQHLVQELEGSQSEQSSVDDLVERVTLLIEHQGTETDASPTGETIEPEEPEGFEAEETGIEVREELTPEFADAESFLDEGTGSAIPALDFEEDYDRELFEIFLGQLQDKAALLGMLVRALAHSTEASEIIQECELHLGRLRSAANYMGYDQLVNLYDDWLGAMETAREFLSHGRTIDLSFMTIFYNRLLAQVPQLEVPEITAEESDSFDVEPVAAPAARAATGGFDGIESRQFAVDEVEDFINEALEHLDDIETGLLQYEEDPGNQAILDDIFRAAHTIKGVAQFIGLARINAVAHRVEDLLSQLRQETNIADADVMTVLMAAKDRLARLVDDLGRVQREESPVDDLLERLDALIQGAAPVRGKPSEGRGEFEEHYDRELYSIFLDQLGGYLAQIRSLVADFRGEGDGIAVVHRIAELVRHLRHAATYMDYGDLVELYDELLGELGRKEFALKNGEQADFAFVDGFVSRVETMFPSLGDVAAALEEETGELSAEGPEMAVPGAEEDLTALADLAASPQPAAPAPPSAEEEDDELFIKLTEALEGGIGASSEEFETLHGVFEQMLEQGGDVAAPARPAAEPAKKGAPKPVAAKEPAAKKSEAIPAKPAVVVEVKPAEPPKSAAAGGSAPPAGGGGDEKGEGAGGKSGGERGFKKSIRVDADKIDSLMNQVGELIVDRSYFFTLYNEMHLLARHLKDEIGIDARDLKQVRLFTYRLGEAISSLSRTSNELQEGVMKVRMLPISQIFNRYPRLIHDLTRNTNKKVSLVIRGEETELDKMIVEELSDPMIHIIRNAVDHGFETADERKRLGKPEQGTLVVEAYQESNHIVIEVSDDGRGIDPEKIKAKALEKKMYTKDELDRMSQRDLVRLIMQPAFSTATQISRTSGRGVGMDVARQNIERLNGTIEVDSQVGKGSQIRLKIPLTLAIIPALLVRVGKNSFTIPLSNVEETLRINEEESSHIEGTEVIHLRGRTMPIFRLATLFNIEGDPHAEAKAFVVVVNAGAEQVGLMVDEMMGQEEVVIKPLVDYLQEKSGFSGATIIGDGRISLILDIYELVHMTAQRQASRIRGRDGRRKGGVEEKAPEKAGGDNRPTIH